MSAERFVATRSAVPASVSIAPATWFVSARMAPSTTSGRIDNQVKVRGFRIELGEIEARLQDAGEVREAVVVARDAASGKQLLGYVVAEDGADASGLLERLRERLKRDLPEYMVPAHLALLPAMPLTPNGKIDRKALPDIDVTASEAYVAPRNELELALAGIWQEVLGIARIGVHDNFFELGGDSILSMQVVAKARALKKLGFQPEAARPDPEAEHRRLVRVRRQRCAAVADPGAERGGGRMPAAVLRACRLRHGVRL
ncbi:phosphopantetheine-binding protein [Pseudomonas aeruginosa]|nr:phosphopantetheine-binding protein [Pseudomonas aeruginosa]